MIERGFNIGGDERAGLEAAAIQRAQELEAQRQYALSTLQAGMGAPMPEMQPPNVNPLGAAAGQLSASMASVLMGRPELAEQPFSTLKEQQHTEYAMALQKRQEAVAQLRAEYERAANMAGEAGQLADRIKYLEKIQRLDKQGEQLAAALRERTSAASEERRTAMAAGANVYGSQMQYAGQQLSFLGDMLKAGIYWDKASMSWQALSKQGEVPKPEEWAKQEQSVIGDVIPQGVGKSKNLQDALDAARYRILALGMKPIVTTEGVRYETAEEFTRRVQRPYVIGGKTVKLLDLDSPMQKKMYSEFIAEHYPEFYAEKVREMRLKGLADEAVRLKKQAAWEAEQARRKAAVQERRAKYPTTVVGPLR